MFYAFHSVLHCTSQLNLQVLYTYWRRFSVFGNNRHLFIFNGLTFISSIVYTQMFSEVFRFLTPTTFTVKWSPNKLFASRFFDLALFFLDSSSRTSKFFLSFILELLFPRFWANTFCLLGFVFVRVGILHCWYW